MELPDELPLGNKGELILDEGIMVIEERTDKVGDGVWLIMDDKTDCILLLWIGTVGREAEPEPVREEEIDRVTVAAAVVVVRVDTVEGKTSLTPEDTAVSVFVPSLSVPPSSSGGA